METLILISIFLIINVNYYYLFFFKLDVNQTSSFNQTNCFVFIMPYTCAAFKREICLTVNNLIIILTLSLLWYYL